MESAAEFVLADDSARVVRHLMAGRGGDARVDILVDNAGFELVGDLTVADYLLSTQSTGTVSLHLKSHPTFVSDAMIKDIHGTLEFLAEDNDAAVVVLQSACENTRPRIGCNSRMTTSGPLLYLPGRCPPFFGNLWGAPIWSSARGMRTTADFSVIWTGVPRLVSRRFSPIIRRRCSRCGQ